VRRLGPTDAQEINNKFTISLGDLKTEIESAKWDATRRAICAYHTTPSEKFTDNRMAAIIIVIVLSAIGVSVYTANIAHSAAQVKELGCEARQPQDAGCGSYISRRIVTLLQAKRTTASTALLVDVIRVMQSADLYGRSRPVHVQSSAISGHPRKSKSDHAPAALL
jgi:hypothetical protein